MGIEVTFGFHHPNMTPGEAHMCVSVRVRSVWGRRFKGWACIQKDPRIPNPEVDSSEVSFKKVALPVVSRANRAAPEGWQSLAAGQPAIGSRVSEESGGPAADAICHMNHKKYGTYIYIYIYNIHVY